MTFSDAEFRQALGSFATGVAVVTCVADGVDHAMTANAVSSVSLHPPLVLVAVARTARFWEALQATPFWSVSMLAADARDHAAWFATSGRPLEGQLDRVPHHRGDHGEALLDQSLAWLQCRTQQVVAAGDHDIVIGEVERLRLGAAAPALLYWHSSYRALPDVEVPE
ncbi:MAG: flavin reductase family protein [Candidatus Nanopelagicales bacterium]